MQERRADPSKEALFRGLQLLKKAQLNVFYHSGDLGDVIYSCPLIRHFGGGVLLLGPDNRHRIPVREKMTEEKAASLKSLLSNQQYIHGVYYSDAMPGNVTHDLNSMRDVFGSAKWSPGMDLVKLHAAAFGKENDVSYDQWLVVDPSPDTAGKTVVSRSRRYDNPKFQWRLEIERNGNNAVFVGSEDEHIDFCARFGGIDFLQTKTLLELAQAICGARLFMGNQSCPRAIAEGLKANCLISGFKKLPNTHFPRIGCQYIY